MQSLAVAAALLLVQLMVTNGFVNYNSALKSNVYYRVASQNIRKSTPHAKEDLSFDKEKLHRSLDREFVKVAAPAFAALVADPLASLVDAIYIGRLSPIEQAATGIAISAQFSIAKLYNDPLLKTSTSLVAGKSGEELSASVATAISTSVVIGSIQTIVFLTLGKIIFRIMGVSATSPMMGPALDYLKWRALGVPAATVVLVTTSIFRGRGDSTTPLFCTLFGNIINIALDPILIFSCNMGCAGAGAATAIAQWISVVPLLYLLNKSVPIKIFSRSPAFFRDALRSYLKAGGLIFLRTVAKIASYTVTSSAAARCKFDRTCQFHT